MTVYAPNRNGDLRAAGVGPQARSSYTASGSEAVPPGRRNGAMTEQETMGRRFFAANETIFEDGDIGDNAYIVESGKVEISKALPGSGRPLIFGYIGVGGIFGEMALIDNKPRMARARAMEPTAVIVVSEATLQSRLGKSDPFIRGLLTIFVRNIRSLTDKLVAAGGDRIE